MTEAIHKNSLIAGSIYLALYTIILPFAALTSYKRNWQLIFCSLLFFTIIRFGSQICAVVFSCLGFAHWQWLIAYLVLGAEGYFVLILSSLQFIIHGQLKFLGKSWIRNSGPGGWITDEDRKSKIWQIRWKHIGKIPYSTIYHLWLIPANAFIVAGGSMLTGATAEELADGSDQVSASKALRTTGQVIFLTLTIIMVLIALHTYFKQKVRTWPIISVLIASPFLVVRGTFGILSIFITKMNYYQMSNYSGGGIGNQLVIYEYVLSTTMEFISMACLFLNIFDKSPDVRDDEDFEPLEVSKSSSGDSKNEC